MALGASLQIYLPSGSTEGIWIVQKSNWTGIGLVIPRNHFNEARQRSEINSPGVYTLVGPALGESFDQRIYIGESDNVRQRLENHLSQKDFWNKAVVFTAKDGSLNKAHIQQIEYRLLKLAREAGRSEVDNGNAGKASVISESESAMTEGFLQEMLTLYPITGLNAFGLTTEQVVGAENLLHCAGPDAQAEGYETADGFVVKAGALFRRQSVSSRAPRMIKRIESMISDGILVVENEKQLRLKTDHLFSSPSMAADCVLGRSANGRTDWKRQDGKTLKQLQEDRD